MNRKHFSFVAITVAATLLNGCGAGGDMPPMAEVTGTVTLKGAPLPDAMVTFVPEKGPVAIGVTDGDGKFSLRTGRNSGAVLGNHRVSVQLDEGGDEGAAATGDLSDPDQLAKFYEATVAAQEEKKEKSLLPEKFASAETSGLSFAVSEGENDFAVEL